MIIGCHGNDSNVRVVKYCWLNNKYSLCHFVSELSYQLGLQSKYVYQYVWALKLK